MRIVFINNFNHSLRHEREELSFIPRVGEEIYDTDHELGIYMEIDESPLWEVGRVIFAYTEKGEEVVNVYLNNIE